jgi:branched-chain amino acid transport system substrate-binding protein
LKLKKAAILRDSKSDYSIGLADFFTKTFTELGGEVVSDEKYTSGDVDFKAQLTSLKNKNFDFIFIPGYYTEVGLIALQARELGLQHPLLGGDGWDSPKLAEIGGAALTDAYFSNHYTAEDPRPEVQEFSKKYEERFNVKSDGLAAAGYDSAMVLFEAMKKAKSLSGPDLREAIAATSNHMGVTGNITIDANRDATKSAVVLKVVDNNYRFVEVVNP